MKPTIAILSNEEVLQIDALSRDILERIGFVCEDEEAISIFADHGARVERDTKTVHIPGGMIDRAKETFRPVTTLYGRGEREPLRVGGDNVYFGSTGFATNYLDGETGEYRSSTYDDLIRIIRLADVLNPPDYINPNVGPTDVDLDVVDLHEFKALLMNTTKHVQTEVANRDHARKMIKMAEVLDRDGIHRGKPFFSFLVTLTSPLHQRPDSMQLIIEGASKGIPLFIESGPMAGATSPVTLSDTVAIANAEVLSSILLAKLVNPDAPVIYASWARVLNMRNANVSVGCPEFGMLRIATSQMGRYYGLPVGGGGSVTDAQSIDAQFGVELCSTSLLPALAGTNMVQSMGLLGGMNATSLETLMLASETANYVRRVCRGIEADTPEAGFERISEVGPCGNFLMTDHTCLNFMKEFWISTIFDCSPVKQGREHLEKNVLANARAQIEKSLRNYTAPRLPENAEAQLDAIIRS